MQINSFDKLFIVLLSDIYAAECFIADVLPKMARKAFDRELKTILQDHIRDTKQQITRIEQIFKSLDATPVNVEWLNGNRLVFEQTLRVLDENNASSVIDALIIALVQRIEHYEIATYGTLSEYADVLDYEVAKKILSDSLHEAAHEDKLLNKLAKGGFFTKGINRSALALSY